MSRHFEELALLRMEYDSLLRDRTRSAAIVSKHIQSRQYRDNKVEPPQRETELEPAEHLDQKIDPSEPTAMYKEDNRFRRARVVSVGKCKVADFARPNAQDSGTSRSVPGTPLGTTDDSPATSQMEIVTENVLQAMRSKGLDLSKRPECLYAIIHELILPHFNFRRMSGWVLGRHWRSATEAQKDRFAKAFQNLLVRTYSRALIDYRDKSINFITSRKRSEEDVTVRAEISQSGGPKIPVSYEMSLTDGMWKVYDIAVNGVSLVINYRSEFNQEIQRNGIDGLIRKLNEHNTEEPVLSGSG